ncbi:hypothetical protein [Tropicibacter naphthalenivorans]|uniref:Uncharacterized protein n=1 Tax=Tropicibacter naphthalenivorans TaxID=441103 RepID=A0A0N7M0H7_9RHOB|nr:hypothetical protein [Tropicibacter naphthalenivorans]CUH80497.1 hypothetical protein TRN7648_03015 [Tropicibacter naphthalenivorans]SMC87067.1 Opacity protein [Tropicibacter naphthalenivorans]
MKRALVLSTFLSTLAGIAQAAEPAEAMQQFLIDHVAGWAHAPVVVAAVQARNAETQGYDAARIDELDQMWRAEVGSANAPTIDPVLFSEASDFLRAQVNDMGGAVTEIFVMDAVGLNVASSDTTSDYWQGDEAKWQQTYSVGAGAHHFSEIEFDESSQTYQAQISYTITDPATGAPIGAITVGVNAESLM